MNNNIIKSWNKKQIRFREDGYGCLTDMAKAANKLVGNWRQLDSTQEYLEVLSSSTGTPVSELFVRNGSTFPNQERGTWAHPDIITEFEKWALKSSNRKPDFLYVIGDINRAVCKIGISSNPIERLNRIQIGYPWELQIWKTVALVNAPVIERNLHRQFKKHALNGEWFDACVFDLIDWTLIDCNPIAYPLEVAHV